MHEKFSTQTREPVAGGSLTVIFCLLLVAANTNMVSRSQAPPNSAKSESEILKWSMDSFGNAPKRSFISKGKEVLVLLPYFDGSGISLRSIYVYIQTSDSWKLVLVRHTNTSRVDIEEKDNRLIFKSKAGKELLAIRLDNLDPTFDSREQ